MQKSQPVSGVTSGVLCGCTPMAAQPVPRFVFRACTSKDKPRKGLCPNGAALSKQIAASCSVVTAIFDATNAGMKGAYFVKIDLDQVDDVDVLHGRQLTRVLETDARRLAAVRKEVLITPSGAGRLHLPPTSLTRGKVPRRALSLEQQSGLCSLESFCNEIPRHLEEVIVDRVYAISEFWTRGEWTGGERRIYHFSSSCPEAKGDNLVKLTSRPKKIHACRCCLMRGSGELSSRHCVAYNCDAAAGLEC